MRISLIVSLGVCLFATTHLTAQIATNWLPGRTVVKLVPDYIRPRVYALNQSTGTNSGTLLALNATNGSTLAEISVGINPTDMAMTPAGDTLYVINAGSRTISKVNLSSFTVVSDKAISTSLHVQHRKPVIFGGKPIGPGFLY